MSFLRRADCGRSAVRGHHLGATSFAVGRSARLTATIAVLATLATGIAGCGTEAVGQPTAVRLDPVRAVGANPFSPPVGKGQTGITGPRGSGGSVAANTVGLFGGTEKLASCDPHKLVVFLGNHPDKAAAWAGVLGIRTTDIATFVSGLTSVILRSDTLVTNHGFVNGHATAVNAVLQAGTAVLVDKHGAPVTRCFCGNPLTRPGSFDRITFVGTPWPTFSNVTITVIQSVSVVINNFVLVEPRTGVSFTRPAGTQGSHDQHLTTPVTPPKPQPGPGHTSGTPQQPSPSSSSVSPLPSESPSPSPSPSPSASPSASPSPTESPSESPSPTESASPSPSESPSPSPLESSSSPEVVPS